MCPCLDEKLKLLMNLLQTILVILMNITKRDRKTTKLKNNIIVSEMKFTR